MGYEVQMLVGKIHKDFGYGDTNWLEAKPQ